MSSLFAKLRGLADSPHTAAYKTARAAAQSWLPKIMRHPASKPFDIVKAARKLTLPVEDRLIVFESETEQALLMDFYLVDYRPDGKSVAETCVFAPGELTPDETEAHRAMLASRTSLFEAVAVHDREPKILLRDRLDPAAPELWLTDLGLAGSIRRLGKVLLFTRVFSPYGLHMTGGFSFVFETKHEPALVAGYRRELWSAPAAHRNHRRTIFFLAQHRRHGLEQAYADVVRPAGATD